MNKNRPMSESSPETLEATETTWWSKFFVFSALLSLVILVSGPFGYKHGLTGLAPSLISILVALVGAGLIFIIGFIMVIVATKKGLGKDRNLILIAMAISLAPMMFVIPQMLKAQSVPGIHDISTDTDNPPEFSVLVSERLETDNDLIYEDEVVGAETAEIQRAAYPYVQTLASELSVVDATNRAAEVLQNQGLEVANVDPNAGLVEATATTAWFGFKDDVVVRVVAEGSGSAIDARSVSRVGRSDIGANAARIEVFLTAFGK